MQASATVLDDLVSRAVREGLDLDLRALRPLSPRPLRLEPGAAPGVVASVVELEPVEGERRLRIEIAYLN